MDILYSGKKGFECVLCLGHFDCLHLGHAEILKKGLIERDNLLREGKKVYLAASTFTASPAKEEDIYPFSERVKLFESIGLDACIPLSFNEIKDMSGADFAKNIFSEYNVCAVICGADYTFGRDRLGVEELSEICEKFGSRLFIVPFLYYNGEKISSSWIKKCLASGDMEEATKLLGRPFSVSGLVVKGDGIGSKALGHPTANIKAGYGLNIKQGVYGTIFEVNGKRYYSVTNYGPRPTVKRTELRLETHIPGYTDGNLYGATGTIEFVTYLREIKNFTRLEELSEQINKDVEWVYDQIRT